MRLSFFATPSGIMTRVPWKTRAEADVEVAVTELLSVLVAVPDGPTITLEIDVTTELTVLVMVLSETDVNVTVFVLGALAKYSPYPDTATIARTTTTATKLPDAMASLR